MRRIVIAIALMLSGVGWGQAGKAPKPTMFAVPTFGGQRDFNVTACCPRGWWPLVPTNSEDKPESSAQMINEMLHTTCIRSKKRSDASLRNGWHLLPSNPTPSDEGIHTSSIAEDDERIKELIDTKPAAFPVAPQTRLDKLRAQGKCKDGGNVAPECFDGPRGEIEAKARRECLESGRNEEMCGVKDAIIYQGWKKCTAASEIGCEMHPERKDSTACRDVRANSPHPDKSTEPPQR